MFLRQFHYLVMLEKEKHFGRAAGRCNVSQPSLSSAIKQLEEELGIPIVLRHQRFRGFTDEGARVLEWAKRILADRDAMLEELSLMRRNLHGHLRVGAMPMSSPVLPVINQLFFNRHPSVQIDIRFLGLDQMKVGLSNFELDVGVTYLEQEPLERLKSLPLYEERLSLLVPEKGFMDDRETMTWAEAAELPLCMLSPFMHERQIMDKAFAGLNIVPKPRLESDSIVNLAFHVMKGGIATIIPKHFVNVLGAFPGTRQVLLEDPVVSRSVGLVWVQGSPMLPMTKAIVDLMIENSTAGMLNQKLLDPVVVN